MKISNKWNEYNNMVMKTDLVDLNKPCYRYMSIGKFLSFIKEGKLNFAYPGKWLDPYEKIYVAGDFTALNYKKPATYCACFTQERDNESSWIAYSYYNKGENKHSVQVRFDMTCFLDLLSSHKYNTSIKFYLGAVSYELNDNPIQNLGKTRSKYHKEAFENFSDQKYADLLLLKRKAFKNEAETRLIILVDGAQNPSGLDVDLKSVDVRSIIKEVVIDPLCKESDYKRFKTKIENILNDNSISIRHSDLYKSVPPAVIQISKNEQKRIRETTNKAMNLSDLIVN